MQEETPHSRTEMIAELQKHAIPFATVQPGSGFDDLMPLKEIIGDARIVALGEATHGTREFFLMKHRLLEFLVKEMNFNLFAIEATWAESNLINEYVHTGKGDPAQLLAGLYFWTWNTQEVLDMILWMRAHNEAPGNAPTISFRGFDMQSFHMAMENVLAYLHNVAPETEEEVKTLYAPFRQYAHKISDYCEQPSQTKLQYRANIQHVYDLLIAHRAAYEAVSSPEQFAHALQSARIVMQAESLFASEEHELRDQYMAENVSWLLEQAGPTAKIVLWAHNGHIGTLGNSMGTHLRKRYGEAMVTFGFSFYEGSLNAIDGDSSSKSSGTLISHEVPPPPEGSYEHMFAATGFPQMFLDLRGVPTSSPLADWLVGPHLFRSIGALYSAGSKNFFYNTRLPEEYDVIIHLQNTTPSLLLPSVNRQKRRNIEHSPRQLRNLNFEDGWTGWSMTGDRPQDYERRIELLNEGELQGKICAYFASNVADAPGFGAFAQWIGADEYRGKQVQMAAYVKSEAVEQWAGLWMRVDGPDGQSQSFDNMQDRAIQGTSDWARYEIVLPVFEDSQIIVFGILLVGKGRLWLRDVQLEIVETL
jgi:erythromycin esterase